MQKRTWIVLGIIFLILVFIIYRYFFISSPTKPEIPKVTVAPVEQQAAIIDTIAAGTVQAFTTVNITSQVAGELLWVGFKEGDVVQKNQKLFIINPKQYEIDLQKAQSQLLHEQAQFETAQLLVKRNKALAKSGYVDQQDYNRMVNNMMSLQAQMKAVEATQAMANFNLEHTIIRSPINGKTGSLLHHPGNIIAANVNDPLVIINQIQPIYVAFHLPEQQLAALQQEQSKTPISVSLVNTQDPLNKQQGKLCFIDNKVEAATGTVLLKAIFPNSDESLWPGQYVKVKIPILHLPKAVLIPTQAIQVGPDGNYVFLLKENNQVKQVTIKLGPAIAEKTVIENGLQAGQLVVTSGQFHLLDGMRVEVINGNTK